MFKRLLIVIVSILALSLGLACISMDFESLQGWASFLAAGLLGSGILYLGWRALWVESLPGWLAWLSIGAALLRLSVGVLWFVALPQWGYGGDVEVAGYVMSDAYNRDQAAWQLAQSEQPLSAAFEKFRAVDQYGGMLFGSAFFYRYLGGDLHQPLQLVVLTAAFSALAVLFVWTFARRLWDAPVASAAAWIVALFPDAVLLGSSQMREAFLMFAALMAFYGLTRIHQERNWKLTAWMVLPLLACLPLSPLFALMLTFMLAVFALFLVGERWLMNWRLWLILLSIVVLVLVVVALFGERILADESSSPIALVRRWLKQTVRWQAYTSQNASGWMQKVFDSTPAWSHTWLLLVYGVARPFLPAALFDPAASIWQGIAIWRSLGWTLLLPFLVLAPWLAWRRDGWGSPAVGLSLLVWVGILVASLRGGGDPWDNPRYRVTWIGLQAALAAWVWIAQRQDGSAWGRRVWIGMGLLLIWWVPWYLRRVTSLEWPIQNVFLTLGLGLVSAGMYLLLDWVLAARKLK